MAKPLHQTRNALRNAVSFRPVALATLISASLVLGGCTQSSGSGNNTETSDKDEEQHETGERAIGHGY